MTEDHNFFTIHATPESMANLMEHISQLTKGEVTSNEIAADETDILTVRDLCEKHERLSDYDYKWTNSPNYRRLSDVLEKLGYQLTDTDIEGEYNDIKAYYNCNVKLL